jgi:hypothetical protein
MSKTPAPGPYEVVVVEDAQGRSGEKWIMIRNQGGAIATVYPAKDAAGTARLLAASWKLLDRLGVARAFIEDQIETLERSYLPEPNEAEADELTEARWLLETIRYVIAEAEGQEYSNATRSDPASEPEGNTKSVFPEEVL